MVALSVCWRGSASAALEQVEAAGEALGDLRDGERPRARGGQLDRERKVVEACAQLGDLLIRLELGARAEEIDGLSSGKRRDRVLDLSLYAEELARGDDEGEVGARRQELRKLGRGVDHLLKVVDEEQQLALGDVRGEAVLGPQRLRDRLGYERWVAQGGERDPEHACLVLRDKSGGRLEREPRLAGASWPCEREQTRTRTDPREHLGELCLPPNEGTRRTGQVRVRDRLEGREGALAELEDGNCIWDVLEPVLAQIRNGQLDELGCRLREDDLTTVRRRRDPRREVHVVADVALLSNERQAAVQADPNLNRPGGEHIGERCSGGECSRSGREGEEKGVALGVDLDAALRAARRADHPAMLGKRLCVALRPELVQELGRAFDVGEEESDGAAGEIISHANDHPLAATSRPVRRF
jgi:hypothetical protein